MLTPTFLPPRSRQFPMDPVVSEIVLQLRLRNWDVPGIKVEFERTGSGADQYYYVRTIEGTTFWGHSFRLWFCRIQGRLNPDLNDIAAVHTINIPREQLDVYEEYAGPTYYRYVGPRWQWGQDSHDFMHHSKVHPKLYGEPRTYLRYTGGWQKPEQGGPRYSYRGRPAPYLVTDNDLDRQYSPEGDEPTWFCTEEVYARFTKWLREELLGTIKLYPLHQQRIISPYDIPFNLFTLVDYDDVRRIKRGQEDIYQLPSHERYGLAGNGYRFVTWDARQDGTVPPLAYEGFLWCGIGDVSRTTPTDDLEIPGFSSSYRNRLVWVRPKNLQDVYIGDMGSDERYKLELIRQDPGIREMTNSQYSEMLQRRARTLIPLSEYHGGYEQPVVLIRRELRFDEVFLANEEDL